MKTTCFVACVATALAATACQRHQAAMEPPSNAPLNAAMIDLYRAEAIENAIVRQHTIYPYLFVQGSDELNDLGRRDLRVLARHFRKASGVLNVRRGDADEQLQAARIAAVRAVLDDHRVDPQRVTIADDQPGGDGLDAQSVLRILEQRRPGEEAQTQTSSESTTQQPMGGERP